MAYEQAVLLVNLFICLWPQRRHALHHRASFITLWRLGTNVQHHTISHLLEWELISTACDKVQDVCTVSKRSLQQGLSLHSLAMTYKQWRIFEKCENGTLLSTWTRSTNGRNIHLLMLGVYCIPCNQTAYETILRLWPINMEIKNVTTMLAKHEWLWKMSLTNWREYGAYCYKGTTALWSSFLRIC